MDPKKITVAIGPLNIHGALGKLESGMSNPGIGGTEFQLLSLALALASNDEFAVEIICLNDFSYGLNTKVKVTKVLDLEDFGPNTVLISPVATISKIHPKRLRNCKIILSSHHPHDKLKKKIQAKLPIKLVRVVGAYSYAAEIKKKPTTYIPNLFLSKGASNGRIEHGYHTTVGNISSYHPSKGTHHVVEMFNLLCKQVQGLRLELVGSSALYSSFAEIRKTKLRALFITPYEIQIEKLVERSRLLNRDCEIKEFGLQSSELPNIVANWSFAIINPLGIGESDPASIKDCLAVNVPVFSTGDFGTWDYQRFFPETTDFSPLKLLEKVATYLDQPDLQRQIQSRISLLTNDLATRNRIIIEVWRKTIHSIHQQDSNPENHSAVFRPSIISRPMFRRIAVRKRLYRFPGYVTISNFIRDRYWTYRLING